MRRTDSALLRRHHRWGRFARALLASSAAVVVSAVPTASFASVAGKIPNLTSLPALCRDISAATVTNAVGYEVPPATGSTASISSGGVVATETNCIYGKLSFVPSQEAREVALQFQTWAQPVSMSTWMRSQKLLGAKIQILSGLGHGAGGYCSSGNVPGSKPALPFETLVVIKGHKDIVLGVHTHVALAKLVKLVNVAIPYFL